MSSLDQLSARAIAAGVQQGDFSAEEVARAALEATEAREPEVQAFLEISADLALAAARRVDKARQAGEKIGPLAGVPVAFKDNMHLVGTRTTCASKMLENYESTFTATCVQRMLDAGATPMGKTNMDEFAFGSSTESSASTPRTTPGTPSACLAAHPAALLPLSPQVRSPLSGLRHGRLHPPACELLWRRGHEAHLWCRFSLRRGGLWISLDQVGPFGRALRMWHWRWAR
jgi:aspartyl-tRNA(Asn)/glutamyl-tRNA(Gln) amidotransferase subunit A